MGTTRKELEELTPRQLLDRSKKELLISITNNTIVNGASHTHEGLMLLSEMVNILSQLTTEVQNIDKM